jgi:hypothetical protein
MSGKPHAAGDIQHLCSGVIFSTIADAKAGLITNLRAQIEGEVLGDLIALVSRFLRRVGFKAAISAW